MLQRRINIIENRNRHIIKIFENLNNIKDIINIFEKKTNDNYIYDYLKNKKFENIFKLIPSLKELDKIIGMEKVKNQVFQMICYFVHELNNPEELNHIVITGPPGVGKTCLARILGKVYTAMGLLSNGEFHEVARSDFVAKYLGQTAIKTKELIEKCKGGIMFIDEAYALGHKNKRDSFAKEALDTLNKYLSKKTYK